MIKVLSSGFLTSIQDLGRKGYANIGVPISGAMDQYSAILANAILGNLENDAVLEITLGSCKFLFENDTCISVSGADFSAKLNDNLIVLNSVLKVVKGDILSFGTQIKGVRTYVSVLGGFKTKTVLNSKSYYQGITRDSLVKKGDLIPFNFNKSLLFPKFSTLKPDVNHFNSKQIKCFKGSEFELLSEFQQKKIKNTIFTVSKANNRMGYLLNQIIENDLKSMLTSAVLPGTVQLTPSGKLIILMRDCQVTGGYPRVLQLTDYAISQLSQKTTMDQLLFKLVD